MVSPQATWRGEKTGRAKPLGSKQRLRAVYSDSVKQKLLMLREAEPVIDGDNDEPVEKSDVFSRYPQFSH